VFPGDPTGSYSEQMTHAYLHGGDIPEALVPFVICRAGNDAISKKSKQIAMAFGLPYVLTVSKPVQPAKVHRAGAGTMSSYAAAAEKGVPSILAEAGGVGQMQEDQVELLVNGVRNVMAHLGMMDGNKSESRSPKSETNSKSKNQDAVETPAATEESKVLTKFEWLYTKHAGMWYPKVAAGDVVKKGQQIGRAGDLFGDTLEKIVSPVTSVVLFLTINPSVLANGLLMGIGVA
jgi:predicted deacylase